MDEGWLASTPRLGCVDNHAERYEGSRQMREGEEVAGGFLVSCGYTPVMLESIDESFDQVALLVFALVIAALHRSVLGGWNNDLGVASGNQLQERVSVIALVGNDSGRPMIAQQFGGPSDIRLLSWTQTEFYRLSLGITGEMQLRAETSSRAPQRFVPFFCIAPAAC